MNTLVALASLRGLGRHPWQIALSVLGIAVGVAVVVGIDLASASSLRGFRLSTQALMGSATHEIRAGSEGLPQELFARLAVAHPEVALAPVIEIGALVVEDPDQPRGLARTTLTVFGIDPFSESALRPWLGGLGGKATGGRALELLTEPATCLMSQDGATSLGLAVGDRLRLRIESRLESVRLLGVIVPEDERTRIALENLLVVDVATAQELCHRPGRLTRIDLAIPERDDAAELEAAIARELPPGAVLQRAPLRGQGLEQMTHSFQLNLHALSLLALLVGVFLIYNTMTFSVVQRRGLIATLRTLGVTRAQVFRTIATEALWLGILGTALGLVLGTQLAKSLLILVSQTMNDLYFVVSVREVHLDWSILAQACVLGVGATFVGALFPAIEATRERPRLVLASSSLESRWRVLVPRLALAGLLCLALSVLWFFAAGPNLVLSFLGLLFLVLGTGLATPAQTVACVRVATPILGWFAGMFGRHAARGIERQLSRTSVAIAALAVAISATVGMGVMVDSFRSTFVKWLERTLEADVYVSAPTLVSSSNTSTLDAQLVEAVRATEGVAEITTYRGFETRAGARTVQAAAITLNAQRERSFDFIDAEHAQVWPQFAGSDSVIISESFGYRHALGRGGRIELPTDRGPRSFEVLGTYTDFASDQGTLLISRAGYERWFDDRGVTSLGVFARQGSDLDALVDRLRLLVPEDQQVTIRSQGALKQNSLAVFERTFAITGVLRLLSTLVAFVGVLSALLALEMERAREVGVLRAQGVTPREVRRMVLCETGLIGTIAGLIAMPLGLALALVLILVINKRSFGWSLDLRLDPWLFLSALGLAIGAALLAGIWPAWRMSRARPALALRSD